MAKVSTEELDSAKESIQTPNNIADTSIATNHQNPTNPVSLSNQPITEFVGRRKRCVVLSDFILIVLVLVGTGVGLGLTLSGASTAEGMKWCRLQ